MGIVKMESQKQPIRTFSFEFFPPQTPKGVEKLRVTRQQLAQFNPKFFSVTFGAGGSTQDRTFETVLEIQAEGYAEAAPHLSCIGSTSENIRSHLQNYLDNGINYIVALRGDLPSGMAQPGEFRYAAELVEFIRREFGDSFHIEVAAYPEVHPDSRSVESDLNFFKAKVDAGANSAITQYFYNPAAYFNFIDACEKKGVSIPIIPGIMPISNFQTLVRFSDMCGADIPRWIRKNLEYYQDDKESLKSFGHEVVLQLCQDLLTGGAPGLHFYTLNQSKPTIRLWRDLGL